MSMTAITTVLNDNYLHKSLSFYLIKPMVSPNVSIEVVFLPKVWKPLKNQIFINNLRHLLSYFVYDRNGGLREWLMIISILFAAEM